MVLYKIQETLRYSKSVRNAPKTALVRMYRMSSSFFRAKWEKTTTIRGNTNRKLGRWPLIDNQSFEEYADDGRANHFRRTRKFNRMIYMVYLNMRKTLVSQSIVILKLKILLQHKLKTRRRAPDYAQALHQIRDFYQYCFVSCCSHSM